MTITASTAARFGTKGTMKTSTSHNGRPTARKSPIRLVKIAIINRILKKKLDHTTFSSKVHDHLMFLISFTPPRARPRSTPEPSALEEARGWLKHQVLTQRRLSITTKIRISNICFTDPIFFTTSPI